MSQKISPVICDGCGADITTTGNSVDWRLRLSAEAKVPWYVAEGHEAGAVTDMYIPRPLDGTKHFCHLGCLKRWVDTEGGSE